MARPEMETYRDRWWTDRLRAADTPKKRVHALQGKLLADISRLPEDQRDAAWEMAARELAGIIDEIHIKVAEEVWA
ncbi:hypothetical protein ACFW2V_12370 [Streptomyces sp. NPDC058947]|uniref:hypothetical protein n=1 Tax=Streptomyces sp. NPDC058947 TaxID=3346675 RepID=UPI0036824BCA